MKMTRATLRNALRNLPSTVLLVFLWASCGGGGSSGGGTPPQPGLPSTQSSSIALSKSGDFLVNVNPDVDTISVFQPTSLAKLAEVAVGGDPQSVVIHESTPTAYVANARDGTVSVVPLPAGPATSFAVGKEPMALALSPNGTRLYVANSASNTLSVVDTSTNLVLTAVDLSGLGTAPRAVSVTNDGDADDTDETVYVALFFSQLRAGKSAVDEGQDDQREGRVAAISAATNTLLGAPNPIVLGPMAVTGFNSNGTLAPGTVLTPAVASTNPQTFTTPTSAFPNQLAAIGLQPTSGRAYVVSTGASPNGPLRFNHMVQGLVSVFDTATRTEVAAAQTVASVRQEAPLNLNRGINFDAVSVPRLFQSNPVALAWRPDGSDAWVVVQNSDLVVRLTTDASGVPTVGLPLAAAGTNELVRVDLQDVPGGEIAGKAPRGIVINAAGTRAWVHNFISRSVTAIDVTTPTAPVILDTAQATAPPAPGSLGEMVQQGAELFHTGRGPEERMSSESWGGCIVCHPNGRADGVTWMFDAGPRQTIPLDGMFNKANPSDQRILNWSAVRDENHDFELNTRGVFGGRGLIDEDRLFFAIGGASGATPTDSALLEQFQQATGVVGTTNDLSGGAALPDLAALTARRDFGVATLPDARVLIIGGRSGAGDGSLVSASDAVLEFDPRANTLTPLSSVDFTLRHSLGAAAVRTSGGVRVYAIGGYASTSSAALPTDTVEEYDPTTNTWRTVATLPTGVAEFGIAVAGGHNAAEPLQLVHVVSGNAGSEAAPALLGVLTATVQRFQADPAGPGTWSTFVTGLTPRRNLGAATVLRGVASRIFVIGGQDAAGTALDLVEEYQAQAITDVLTLHTSLPAARARFGIGSSLTTNQIYVVGGVDGAGADQATILENTIANNGPVSGPTGTPSGSWVTRGNLSEARRGVGLSTPPPVTNFLPVQSTGRDDRQDTIAVWIAAAVRSSGAPVLASDPQAIAGRTLFGTTGLVIPAFSCATCHGGSKWTRSTVDYTAPPSPDTGIGFGNEQVIGAELRVTATQPGSFPGVLINVGTFAPNAPGGRTNEIRFNGADVSQAIAPLGANGFNIPSLLSVHESAPYFYSGLAQTLEEVLDGSQDSNGGTRHHFVTDPADRAALVAFLRLIDDTTPLFP